MACVAKMKRPVPAGHFKVWMLIFHPFASSVAVTFHVNAVVGLQADDQHCATLAFAGQIINLPLRRGAPERFR